MYMTLPLYKNVSSFINQNQIHLERLAHPFRAFIAQRNVAVPTLTPAEPPLTQPHYAGTQCPKIILSGWGKDSRRFQIWNMNLKQLFPAT